MSQPINGGLAKRIAEAADGLRDGKYHYFVCLLNNDDKSDYDLHYVSADTDDSASEAADALKSNLGSSYYKFGPYKTNDDCGSPLLSYDSAQLQLTKQGFSPLTITISTDTDAIVFSLSAFDKFMLPYYTKLYGTVIAAQYRSLAIDALSDLSKKPPPTHSNVTAYNLASQAEVSY